MPKMLTAEGSTRAWRALRELVLARDDGLCQIPRADGRPCLAPATCVDHIVPRARWPRGLPGVDDPANLRAACRPCNADRGHDPLRIVRDWSWT